MKKNYVVETIRKAQMVQLLANGKRLDGRGLDQPRELKIETGVIPKANGSARVTLGNTQVIAGVKIATGIPFPDTPDKGILMVNAEILPLSSPYAEAGPPSEDAIELARVTDRGIRESEMVDMSKLSLIPGKSVIAVFVDCNVMNVDGNLFDATSYAVVSALRTAKMKKYVVKDDKVETTDELIPVPVERNPVSVTVARIGDRLVVDPSAEEEGSMDMRITITTDDDGNICASQKGEASTITPEQVLQAADTSIKVGKAIRAQILEATR
ncbi:MAG: exosome complex protein Rrp42 [Nitrososphaerota archaeon]|nr:exosome complex protein Rrp42 [Nitrososphaerota archaeon]MDG6953002.1 exosome complex protein Rrp42 [Nitrososphaerota archaeon]MDG6956919.1 exosome complex protein Rrp42 [Nitrososphaerota archaeon]MDG6957260.1 exosome complex protein Rrp42 [Nitrososphaerota archaeon]MDG6959895.1 exosome complex protein Rrp42 [Nitrososphaerota archaeon]